jgi:peptidoglycan/LPS O-acetylase OafA/YrhL
LLSRAPSALGRALSGALGARALHPIAHLSYAAYLLHPLCIAPLLPRLGFDLARPWTSYGLVLACSLVATFAAALLVFLLLEHPVMQMRPPRAAGER